MRSMLEYVQEMPCYGNLKGNVFLTVFITCTTGFYIVRELFVNYYRSLVLASPPHLLTALGGVLVWVKRLINKLIISLLKLFKDEHSASSCLWLFGCFGLIFREVKRSERDCEEFLSLTNAEFVVVLNYATVDLFWSLTSTERTCSCIKLRKVVL